LPHRTSSTGQNLAIGVRCSGYREVLGIWIEQTEGAKFWLRVMTEIRNRGAHDVLIAALKPGTPRPSSS
jgi:transposase-like protein